MKKNIFITGATDGLGLALAKTLLASKNSKNLEKYNVALVSRDLKKTESLAKELNCAWASCDIGNWESVDTAIRKLVSELKNIDCLVHCAGTYATGKLEDLDPEVISRMFEVNTLGTIYVIKALVSHMTGKGQIILVNSIVGFKETARPGHWVYPLSKTWAMEFSNVIASELAANGINISVVYPGAMQTGFAEKNTGIARDTKNALSADTVAKGIKLIIDNPEIRVNALALTHLEDYQRV